MKRFLALITAVIVIFYTGNALAAPTEFSGGVNNEYEYQEYVFLSGEPVKFSGTYRITESESKDKKTIAYKFDLTSENSAKPGKLTRQMTYTEYFTERNDKGQTIATMELTRMKETIQLNGVSYELKDYQFSKSDIIDNRPVSDYYTGNVIARKYYTINDSQGKVIVEISGGDVGYNNFWGSTETQIIDYVINTTYASGADGNPAGESWQGTVRVQVSDSTVKTLKYDRNEAAYSSIEGGHMKITTREMVSIYDYDLPRMSEGKPVSNRREKGTVKLSQEMLPSVERLIVPKFRDVSGHWAEEYINMLYSLDVFDESAQFFMPDVSMTRAEFTKGVMRACNIRPGTEAKKTTITSRSRVKETSVFKDVSVDDADYQYIKDAVRKGIIKGVSEDTFRPDDPLTRAEAVVILIRALGFESMAPNPGYSTSFGDDRLIPAWAKDSIYVAKEIGLIKGDNRNYVNAGKALTRAEASTLLANFLEFLQRDLQKDYRENILLY